MSSLKTSLLKAKIDSKNRNLFGIVQLIKPSVTVTQSRYNNGNAREDEDWHEANIFRTRLRFSQDKVRQGSVQWPQHRVCHLNHFQIINTRTPTRLNHNANTKIIYLSMS